MTVIIGRRELLAALGGAVAAWLLAARAQPAMPVIGFLQSGSPGATAHTRAAFHAVRLGLGHFQSILLSRHTKRRERITLLGGAVGWPVAAHAQRPGKLSPHRQGRGTIPEW